MMSSIRQRLDRLEIEREDGELVTVIDFGSWGETGEAITYTRQRLPHEPRRGIYIDLEDMPEGD